VHREDWIDGEDDAAAAYAYPRGATSSDHTDYKQTNSILHEVHALHQHRLIFSQPSSEPFSHLGFSAPPLSTATHLPLQSSHGLDSPSSFSSDGKVSIPECPVPGHYSHLAHVALALNNSAAYTPLDFHEVKSVRERYEDTNKLLGSLFLLRRRELQGGNPSISLVRDGSHREARNLL